ncbi:MAG: CocE/NonD family hydrolase [Planctomycetota bacterium]|jgi:putative CocE/NonD family hydrolase
MNRRPVVNGFSYDAGLKNAMKHIQHYLVLLVLISSLLSVNGFCQDSQQKADDSKYVVRNNFITMDDGVQLATDIYLPVEKGKFPCILMRTPYSKAGARSGGKRFAENGFVLVAQDCRGKYASEGKFYPFANERRDGLATVKWIREQSWSNGKVGGWGGSYVGYTQWAISDELDAMTPGLSGADFYDLFYPGGLFSLHLAVHWGFLVDNQTRNEVGAEELSAGCMILPLSVADDLTVKDSRFFDDWISHPLHDEYWEKLSHRGRARCPVLLVGGWYDILLIAQLNDFEALDENVCSESRLVIGPWCHGKQAFKNEYGGIEKTGDARGGLMRRFVSKYVKGEDVKVIGAPFKDKRCNLFIMERNEYYGCDEWPPKATSFINYYIGPDKYFCREVPQEQGRLEYTYDPANPYPNKGGTILRENVGPALQNENLSRADQVVFETEVLESPLTLLGPIGATLYVSSDVVSTDFIVCLQDVFPNSNIINIQDGGTTVKFEGAGVKKADVSVWATGYQVNPGHKLRAVITSSLFPRFNRNLNSGEPIFSAKTIKKAHQKIYFGPAYPSAITLPVLGLE